MKAPWILPSDAPVIEQSIHDYIVSIYRQLSGPVRKVEIVPISPGAEATRGWDAAVVEALPLYFQYKYPDFTSRPQSSQPTAYLHRKGWAFDDREGLFHFGLRARSVTAPKSQHEFMVDLQNAGERVFYVAPTFIDVKRLRSGGDPVYDRPWLNSRLTFRRGIYLDHPVIPYFEGLICIPPQIKVSDPPEDHRFYFNTMHEVSLHSEPIVIKSSMIEQIVFDQIDDLFTSRALTKENISAYVEKILQCVSHEGNQFSSVFKYFEASLSQSDAANENPLMQKLRGLARVLRKLYGVEMLLTVRKL